MMAMMVMMTMLILHMVGLIVLPKRSVTMTSRSWDFFSCFEKFGTRQSLGTSLEKKGQSLHGWVVDWISYPLPQDFFSLRCISSLLGRSPKWKVQLIKSQLSKTLEWANKNLQCVGDFWESRYVRSISILCRCTSTFSNAWME